MTDNTIPRIKTTTESYVLTDYPAAIDFAEKQNSVFWLHNEIKVEKDKQDLLVNMTEAEKHGVITTLKLFTLYEIKIGTEWWGEVIAKRYPRPEIQRMTNAFAFFELNVHAPFYNKINEELGLATHEFYTSYVNDPTLKARIDFIDNVLNDPNELVSLAAFSMIEGAVLYSSFAFLKHFQSEGKNKLMNVVRGINFSVRDENLHSKAGAWLYKAVKLELADQKKTVRQKLKSWFNRIRGKKELSLEDKIYDIAKQIRDHEFRIIEMIFEKGPISGITAEQMKDFVESRINECLVELGLNKMFDVPVNLIAEWFYDGINNFQFNDFFTGIGNQYNRDWDEEGFVWRDTLDE